MSDTALPFHPCAPKDLPKPGPRKPLTRAQVIELCIMQIGFCPTGYAYRASILCGCGCGNPLRPDCVDEHWVARDMLPADRADDISNRRLLNPECAARKTQTDQGKIAKERRRRGGKGSQTARRERNGPSLKSNAKLRGAGFRGSRKFDGTVVWKEQG